MKDIGIKMEWHGERIKTLIAAGSDKGAQEAAHELKNLSSKEVPLEAGLLKASGKVTKIQDGKYVVGYGFDNDGTDTHTMSSAYARRQHEELEWFHEEGKAKYLEDPFESNKEELRAIIAGHVGEVL